MKAMGIATIAAFMGIFAHADGPNTLKSGPQVGAKITKAFEVKMCNGPDAGDMACLV